MARSREIIVGVDGSEHSVRALRWALEEARLRGSELCVLSSWILPAAMGVMPIVADTWDEVALAEVAHTTVRETVAQVGLDDVADVSWRVDVPCGPAAAVLIEESEDAEMIVVGSRGRGGFAGLLLGSVSQQLAAHSHCPVVIVH